MLGYLKDPFMIFFILLCILFPILAFLFSPKRKDEKQDDNSDRTDVG
jgi:hypothetical protein